MALVIQANIKGVINTVTGSTTSTSTAGAVLAGKVTVGGVGAAGKSTYELWLAAGNTGSLNDYLTSLKGATGAGVPAGGQAGQVLAKASIGDYDTSWITFSPNTGNATSLTLASPDGTLWTFSVDNAGHLILTSAASGGGGASNTFGNAFGTLTLG